MVCCSGGAGTILKKDLMSWYKMGLSTISISIVHYDEKVNKEIFTPNRDYPSLSEIVAKLHDIGFMVRLSCVMYKGAIDSPKEVKKMIGFAKNIGAEQLSIRPVERPEQSENKKVY